MRISKPSLWAINPHSARLSDCRFSSSISMWRATSKPCHLRGKYLGLTRDQIIRASFSLSKSSLLGVLAFIRNVASMFQGASRSDDTFLHLWRQHFSNDTVQLFIFHIWCLTVHLCCSSRNVTIKARFGISSMPLWIDSDCIARRSWRITCFMGVAPPPSHNKRVIPCASREHVSKTSWVQTTTDLVPIHSCFHG